MNKFKFPEPDGFREAFFQDYWHIIKKEVCSVVISFIEERKLLEQINHTLIALSSKVNNPTTTNLFRPISLCNTVYKIISKIIANRMCPILEKVIDPIQSFFVHKHSIHDNILLAYKTMTKLNNMKGKKAWVALKVDLEKAYNKVGTSYSVHYTNLVFIPSG